jgi:hypothetical protein
MHSIFAAAKRQMKRAPTPDPQVADDFVKFGKEYITKHIGEYLKDFRYSFNQWYNHNSAKKQKDIDQYLHALRDKSAFTEKQYKDIMTTNYKGICKLEIQPLDGKPRMVCAIPIRTKVCMGPVTWRLEEICADHLPGYCGNKNLAEMTDKINGILAEGFTKIVEGDGSGFDNTQDVSLKELDRWLYRQVLDKVYHVPQSEFQYISQQLYKNMVVEYIEGKKKKTLFEYSILGSVFSGDCDTTLCNTIRMALYNIYVNEKAGLRYGKDYKLFSKGDDFTVFYKPYVSNAVINQAYDKYFIRSENVTGQPQTYGLGQILKFLSIGGPDTISFCSLRAIYTDVSESKIILVRDYKKFEHIARYARKIKALSGKSRIAYLKQQAISLRAVYKGIKLFEEMANAYDLAANQYAMYLAKGDKDTAEQLCKQSLKLITKIVKYYKIEKPTEADIEENGIDNILYNIGKNRVFFKVLDDYWSTVKMLQEKVSYKLTLQEYEYINQQLESIMSLEIFKSDMGLKNSRL